MEKSGLLIRGPHEQDRRAHRVKIQPAGRRAFEKARVIAMELQDEILAELPASRRAKFLDELEVIALSCANALEKPSKRPRR
jgi:DNA-binding MarR family transcriptional regulator